MLPTPIASDNSIMLIRSLNDVLITGNTFRAGHYRHFFRGDDMAGVVTNNQFDADFALDVSGLGFDEIIMISDGPGPKNALDVSHNTIKVLSAEQRLTTFKNISIIGTHDAVTCSDNTVRGAHADATADITVTAVDITMYGNITDGNGVFASASGTQKPATLTDHNI